MIHYLTSIRITSAATTLCGRHNACTKILECLNIQANLFLQLELHRWTLCVEFDGRGLHLVWTELQEIQANAWVALQGRENYAQAPNTTCCPSFPCCNKNYKTEDDHGICILVTWKLSALCGACCPGKNETRIKFVDGQENRRLA